MLLFHLAPGVFRCLEFLRTFHALCVDIAKAVYRLNHNLGVRTLQPIFIHMVALAIGVVVLICLTQDAEVETCEVHVAAYICRFGVCRQWKLENCCDSRC